MDQIKKIKIGSTYYSVLPEGGTTGQVLKKNSATNFDTVWGDVELDCGNSKIFYGTCTVAAATTEKTVTCPDFTSSDLVDGVMVLVKFSNTNSGAVGSLTLNVNSTGAKGIKKIYTTSGVSNLTSAAEICANSVIPFIYNGTNWIVTGLDYNSTYNLNSNYVSVGYFTIGAYPLASNSLCAFDVDGKLTPFTTTATTSTGKTLVTSTFPIGAKIYMANASYSANTNYSDQTTILTTVSIVDLRYSSVNHNLAIFPNSTFNRVFMPVVVNMTNNTFTLTTQATSGYTNNFTNQRSLISGNFYIEIGFNSGASYSYNASLIQDNGLFYYDGTKLIDYNTYLASTQPDWNQTTTTAPDYIENKPAIKAGTGTSAIVEGDLTNNTASGTGAIAEGETTRAFGNYSHTEGYGTVTYDDRTHAEGYGFNPTSSSNVIAFKVTGSANTHYYTIDVVWTNKFKYRVIYYNGEYARITNGGSYQDINYISLDKTLDSENELTNVDVLWVPAASMLQAHTEGVGTSANGNGSHAEGSKTEATNSFEHAEGQYNLSNQASTSFGNAGNTLHSIGIGTSDSDRKNAVEVMQNGDVYIKGAGSYNGTNPGGTGVKTLQTILNEGAQLETEEASAPGATGGTKRYNIVLVDGSDPYDPQSGNVVTDNNTDINTIGLGVTLESGGSATLFCDSYSGNVDYYSTYVPSGKVLIGTNNRGSFKNTTQEVPASTSVTAYTSDYIVGAQALLKSNERYITNLTSLQNINASYNTAVIRNWWGSTTILNFSQFPANKHITLFIIGEIGDSADIIHTFTIVPKVIMEGIVENPVIFLNGPIIDSTQTLTVRGNQVLEMDLYYANDGTNKYLIIRYA